MYSDGYKYWLAYKKNNTNYFRCSRYKNQCSGRCVVEDGKIRSKTPHNHNAEPDRILVDRFRKSLTQRSSTEQTELYSIYWEEATQRHSEAALLYTFTQAESAMRKARRKQLPKAPNTIRELGDILAVSDLFRIHTGSNKDPFYQSSIVLEDSTCVIFMHKKTIEKIGNVNEIMCDASFQIIPQNPPSYYLFTAHAVQTHQCVPILYAIVTTKNQNTFASLFAFLREQLSSFRPNIIISEFDIGMQTALQLTFPEATIKGSWFHYTEAVVKQMKYLGLQRETTKGGHSSSALRMLMSLPLLPAEYMNLGLEALKKWMQEKGVFSTGIQTLCDFVEQCWLRGVGVDKMSIFGLKHGVNNHLQSFNKDLRNAIGIQNPTIWQLLECLTTIATKNYVKISKKLGSSPAKQPRKGRIVVDTIINNATDLWIRTAVHLRNPLQFLQLSSHCIQDINHFAGIDDNIKINHLNQKNIIHQQQQQQQNQLLHQQSSSYVGLMQVVQQPPQNQQQQQQYSMITLNNNNNNNTINNNCNNNLFNTNNINLNNINNQYTTQIGNRITVLPLQYQQQQIYSNLSIENYQTQQITDPPPLAFFPKVKKVINNSNNFRSSEPPPLLFFSNVKKGTQSQCNSNRK